MAAMCRGAGIAAMAAPTGPRALRHAQRVGGATPTYESKRSASMVISDAAPLSMAALCASVRGRMRAK